jgi:hypothetical protein
VKFASFRAANFFASQAENASSILVARSKDLRIKPSEYWAFRGPLVIIAVRYCPVLPAHPCQQFARGMPSTLGSFDGNHDWVEN